MGTLAGVLFCFMGVVIIALVLFFNKTDGTLTIKFKRVDGTFKPYAVIDLDPKDPQKIINKLTLKVTYDKDIDMEEIVKNIENTDINLA